FGLPHLAKYHVHFWELMQHPVLDLQDACGFANGNTCDRRGHVKDVALVEWGHELLAELKKRIDGDAKERERHNECQPAESEHEMHERLIGPNEETVYGVSDFRRYFPAH